MIEVIQLEKKLTLEELSSEVERLLVEIGVVGAQDRRVSSVPDSRTIRYYTTLGILDRPTVESRQAFYNRRHLLQLLAIKLLQSFSLPLSEIQARLYGKSNKELEAIVNTARTNGEKETPIKVLVWHEVTIEPGLKLMVEQDWSPNFDLETLQQRIRAALIALGKYPETKEQKR
ncbi:MAG: MerR family transcriptional regulator [Blastocatellia bacterium]|nr:MerR family transcriptional regulator [Blastocatellia bacterium]